MFAQIDFAIGDNFKTWLIGAVGLLLSMIIGRFIQAFRNGSGITGAVAAVWLGTNTPTKPEADASPKSNSATKPLLTLLTLFLFAAALPASAQTIITTDTNGVTTTSTSGVSTNSNWTNITVTAWSGYQYLGNSGASTATLGASITLGYFTFGQLGDIGYGANTEFTIAATGSALDSGSLRGELTKDLGSTQVGVFAGGGYSLSKSDGFCDVGTIVRYNLYKTTSWFAWLGTGITFRFYGDGSNDYMPTVATGIAF